MHELAWRCMQQSIDYERCRQFSRSAYRMDHTTEPLVCRPRMNKKQCETKSKVYTWSMWFGEALYAVVIWKSFSVKQSRSSSISLGIFFQSFYLCAHFHHAYISSNTYYLTVCSTICYPCTLTSIISVSFYFMISSTANPHTVISSLHIFFKFNSNAKWICDNWTYIHTRIFYVSFFHQICSW